MRVKTRSGMYTTLPADSVLKQEKRVGREETYYVLHLRNGNTLSTLTPVDGVPTETTEERKPHVEKKR